MVEGRLAEVKTKFVLLGVFSAITFLKMNWCGSNLGIIV